jgi:hypothetical protein
MARKIKPQRTQRVVIFPFRLLCVLCVLCGFPKPYFENIKKSLRFWSLQLKIPESHLFCHDPLNPEEIKKSLVDSSLASTASCLDIQNNRIFDPAPHKLTPTRITNLYIMAVKTDGGD